MPDSFISLETVNLGKPFDQLLPKLSNYDTLYEAGFTWHIRNWAELEESVGTKNNSKVISPAVRTSDPRDKFVWKLFLYPKGNLNDKSIAVYLKPEPLEKNTDDWSVCVQFGIFFSRPEQDDVHIGKVTYFRFSNYDTDWGFSDMMNITKFKTKYSDVKDSVPTGLLVDGNKINITCYVRVINDETGVTWHNFKNYDSKKTTNYIGFQNQGATCYLNSLLQTYFILNKFKKMVYNIDTCSKVDPTEHVDLALQRLFYNLQKSHTAVNTVELTKSFGWDSGDNFVQHDIQELNRLLLDKLGESMDLKSLFVGEMKSYIKCLNVDYNSSKVEEFWDIQLNVKGMNNIQESFDYYIKEELLEGENLYFTDDYGFQEAKKGVIFTKFPPILFIQLNRFEYDFNLDRLAKINDRYVFTDTLNLEGYRENLTKTGEEYQLHGVLVHSGDLDTGHYYAVLKPKDKWMTFDDDKVWRVRNDEVFEDNFGTPKKSPEELKWLSKQHIQRYFRKRQTSAYMLVYIRKDQCSEVLAETTEHDIPANVVSGILKEKELELQHKELINEMKLTYKLKVLNASSLSGYRGFDLFANPASKLFHPDFDSECKPDIVKVCREISVSSLKEMSQFSGKNIWTMGYSKAQGLRINKRIERGFLKDYLPNCLDSFVLVEDVLDPNMSLDKEFLVFAKIFHNQSNENLIIPVKVTPFMTISHIYTQLMQNYPSLEPVCWEEIGPNEVERLEMETCLLENDISNGDIIAFGENALQIYKEIRFRIKLRFKPLLHTSNYKDFMDENAAEKINSLYFTEKESDISIWVTGQFSYVEVAKALAKRLDADYRYLRICAEYENKKVFMASNSDLKDYLIQNYTFDTIPEFGFQILNIPLKEFENQKTVKVKWFSDNFIHFKLFEIKLTGSSTVKDLRAILVAKIMEDLNQKSFLNHTHPDEKQNPSDENHTHANEKHSEVNPDSELSAGKSFKTEEEMLTLWSNNKQNRFSGILNDSILIDDIEATETICARQFSIAEENKTLIVIQYYKHLSNTHGVSFVFQLIPSETFIDALDRLNDVFGLGKKEFSKIKFSSFSHKTNSTLHISSMSNAELSKLVPFDLYDSSDIFFMDHPDRIKVFNASRQMTIR